MLFAACACVIQMKFCVTLNGCRMLEMLQIIVHVRAKGSKRQRLGELPPSARAISSYCVGRKRRNFLLSPPPSAPCAAASLGSDDPAAAAPAPTDDAVLDGKARCLWAAAAAAAAAER